MLAGETQAKAKTMPSPNEVLPTTSDLKTATAAPAPPLSPTCEMEHAYPAAFEHGVCIGCGGAQPAELAAAPKAPATLRTPEGLEVETSGGTIFVCFGPARARLRIGMGVPEAHNLSDLIARAEAAGRAAPRAAGELFSDAAQAAGLFPGLEEYVDRSHGVRLPSDVTSTTIADEELIAWGAAPAEGGAVALGFVVDGPPVHTAPGVRISPHQRILLLVHDARAFGGKVLRAAAIAQSQIQGTPYEGPTAEDDLSQRAGGVVPRMGRA